MIGATYGGVMVLTGGIVATLFEGVRRRDVAATVNSVASLAVVLVPLLVEFGLYSVGGRIDTIGPVLPLWIAAAGFLHSLGMLGLYDTIRWWDSLTHTVSAALVAALVYAGLVAVVHRSPALDLSPVAVAGVTVLFTFWVGVTWELVELVAREIGERFDVKPVLVHYGWRDTVFDLGFDLVGALLVVLVDLRVFVPVAEKLPGVSRTILVGSASVTAVGSLLMALGIGVSRKT